MFVEELLKCIDSLDLDNSQVPFYLKCVYIDQKKKTNVSQKNKKKKLIVPLKRKKKKVCDTQTKFH